MAWLCASAGAQTGTFEAEARPIEVGESASGSVSLAVAGNDLTNNGCDMIGRVELSVEGFGDRDSSDDYYKLEIPRVENTSGGGTFSHAWCYAYVRITERIDPESTGFNIVKGASLGPGADGGTVNGTAGGVWDASELCNLIEPGEYCADIVLSDGPLCESRHSRCGPSDLDTNAFNSPPPGQYFVHVFTAERISNPPYQDLVTLDGILEVPGSSAFMEGRWSYRFGGDEVTIEIERIVNATDRTTGPLYLTLWLTTDRDPYSRGYTAARHGFATSSGGRLGPGESFDDVSLTMDFVRPAQPGNYYFHVFTSQHPDPDKILHVRTSSRSHHFSGGRTQSDDDHGDSRSDATRVSLPSRTTGEIDPGDDEDYFRFEVSRRGEVVARTTGGLDAEGALYDSSGSEIARNSDGGEGDNFRIRRELEAGTYYVRVSSRGSDTGVYALHLSIETGGSPDLAVSSLSADRREVDPGERFTLSATVRNRGDARSDATTIRYYRTTGGRDTLLGTNSIPALAPSGTASDDFRARAETAPGTYAYKACVAEVSGESNTANNCGSTVDVQVRRPSSGGDDHGDSRSNATRVSLPSETSGEIDPGDDEDYFRFEVSARGEVLARTTGGLDTLGALYDADGAEVATDDDGGAGTNFGIQRQLDAGAYYVRVSSWRAGTGAYALHLSFESANGGGDGGGSSSGGNSGGLENGGYRRTLGDFDGDGRDDVLLRHQDGRWHFHPMNGRHAAAGAGRAALTGNLEWSVAGVGDLNGDGKDDVLLRKPTTGAWYYYPMNGRLHLPERGGANLTSDLAWSGPFPIGGTSGGANGAPTVATAIANRSLATGGDATLDLSDHFSDDQTLVYEVRSSDAEVVRVSVTGGVLTLMPVAEGSATVTVTARDPDGNEATQTFSVTVGPSGGDSGGGGGGQAGERFRDCDACPEMVVVPAGTFLMGAPESEVESHDYERPVHAVTVPSFAVGAYEVTFEEWDACVAGGGCGGYRPEDWENWGRGRRPVIHVSWDDAQSYVEWLSSRTGERYRLPSESEWEYAARAVRQRRSTRARRSRRSRRTTTGATSTLPAKIRTASGAVRRCRWARSARTRLVCTTFTATSMNGCRTA